jgi:hypothetical protein
MMLSPARSSVDSERFLQFVGQPVALLRGAAERAGYLQNGLRVLGAGGLPQLLRLLLREELVQIYETLDLQQPAL